MNLKFREKLLTNEKFNNTFNNLISSFNIIEIPKEIWDIIEKDKSLQKVEEKTMTLSSLLKEGYNEGMCYLCSIYITLLLHIHGYETYQVAFKNEYFKGTKGSENGGHYAVEVLYNNKWYILDTSLLCMINKYNTYALGYEEIKKIKAIDMLLDETYLSIYNKLKNQTK